MDLLNDLQDILSAVEGRVSTDKLTIEQQKEIIGLTLGKMNEEDLEFATSLVNRLKYIHLLRLTSSTYNPELAAKYKLLYEIYGSVFDTLEQAHHEFDAIYEMECAEIDNHPELFNE